MFHSLWRYRYGFLFFSLLLVLLTGAFALNNSFEEEIFTSVVSLVLIASVNALYRKSLTSGIFLGLGLLGFVTNFIAYFTESMVLDIESLFITLLFLSCAIGAMCNHIFSGRRVDADMLLGAASLYLLIGISFSYAYTLADYYVPSSFRGALAGQAFGFHALLAQFLYYSFSTLTTLGYGDIVPASQCARFLSVIEAVISQLYMAIMIARLVGLHLQTSHKS